MVTATKYWFLLSSLGLFCLTTATIKNLHLNPNSHLWPRLSPKHSSRQVRSLLEFSSTATEEDQDSLPPLFQDDFEAEVEVKNLFTGDSYFIQERVKRDSVWLQMTSKEDKIRTCTYSKLSGFGHTIYGLECLPAVNLPSGCFCASSPSPTPYLPLTDLLALVAKKGVNRTQVSVETKDFISWHVDADNIHLSATFINDLNHSLHGLAPFTLSLTHNDTNPNYFSERDQSCGNVRLDYTVHKWESPSPASPSVATTNEDEKEDEHSFGLRPSQGGGGGASIRNDWTIAPEGVFCQRPDIYRKKIPDIPDHFSVKIETIDEDQKAVTFSEEHYDFSEKLVAFQFAPRSHTPPAIFFTHFLVSPGFPNDFYRLVHDFSSQLQYTLNERTGNCSVREIPASVSMQLSADSGLINRRQARQQQQEDGKKQENTVLINTKAKDAAPLGSLRHVRLRHAKELLSVDPKKFVYSGARHLRGVPSDVWIAESIPDSDSNEDYTTIELHFSRPDYHILVEEVNSLSQIPLGMRTFSAKSKNSSGFEKRVTSHYYDFNPSRPMWKFFDVSSCLAELDKLHLKVTLDVSYTLLVQFSLQKAHDSIRKAIAGISGISPLRISHLHLSTAPGDSEAIDVWFVMLDRPNLYLRSSQKIYAGSSAQGSASRLSNRPRLISISEAYRNLAQLISQRDIPLKLPLNKDREVIARLRKHSLQVAPESVYPSSSRRGSYRFLRASYTAGSMAGLGFSMVILGICIGIFLGFLLWKRRLGVIPYYLNP